MCEKHAAANNARRLADCLQRARLYVIVDAQMPNKPWEQHIGSLIRAGVDMIQLRDKRLPDRQLLRRAQQLRKLTRGTSTLFIMNDRPDLGYLARADGVHVGQEELAVSDVRSIIGPEPLVGVSTHSIDQARQAVRDGASYIGVGPTFPSETKHFDYFPGLGLLQQVATEISLPAFAIGGIELDNLTVVLETGCQRVAVRGAINAADHPVERVNAMKKLLAGRNGKEEKEPNAS